MKNLLFSVFAILLVSILLIPAAFAVEYVQVASTSGGSLDVGIYTEPDPPYSGETTTIKIHFLEPDTSKLYEHIDYWTAVSKDGDYISGPSTLKHTNPGIVTVSVVFPEDGSYKIDVGVEGILFQVIPVETATFTMNIGQAVKDVKAGKIDFKVDKYGIVHAAIGKASFESNQIVDNANELIAALVKLKPSSAKGQYVKSVTLSSTMSPGVKVEPKSVDA